MTAHDKLREAEAALERAGVTGFRTLAEGIDLLAWHRDSHCADADRLAKRVKELKAQPDPAPADALRELRDWLMYVYVYEPGIDHHPVLNDVADKLDELLARAATPAAADRSADDASRWDEERNQPCPKHGGGNCDC